MKKIFIFFIILISILFISNCRFMESYTILVTYNIISPSPITFTYIDKNLKKQEINNLSNWNYSFEYIIYSDQYIQNIFIPTFSICIQNPSFEENVSISINFDNKIYKDIKSNNNCTCEFCIKTITQIISKNW